ncbi:hypothetical protein [Burkholderia sp. BCC1644]|uniref:hypothetical protein n=1 Tax=Burkholderia sp. BCC1644 TaxID=2676293 RepID=UPI001591D1CF|nr:hypothetical protein [Burkholderia sp. BCC1644]
MSEIVYLGRPRSAPFSDIWSGRSAPTSVRQLAHPGRREMIAQFGPSNFTERDVRLTACPAVQRKIPIVANVKVIDMVMITTRARHFAVNTLCKMSTQRRAATRTTTIPACRSPTVSCIANRRLAEVLDPYR